MAAVCALGVAVLGTLATDLGGWYASLRQPAWKPPDAWFGPIWTLIFATAALSAATAWWASATARQRLSLAMWWSANAFLNVTWSLLFFRLHRPDWALLEVSALWGSILGLFAISWPISRRAAWCLLPYAVWVALAAWLNSQVVHLNAPFGGS